MSNSNPVNPVNLDKAVVFPELSILAEQKIDLKTLLTEQRIKNFLIKNSPLYFSYATCLLNKEIVDTLQLLADEQNVINRYQALLNGQIMNTGETRKVLHHATRSPNTNNFYQQQLSRIRDFSASVHNDSIKGYTGKKFTSVVQIGIGGSDLGPRALYTALKRYVKKEKGHLPLKARFIANIDPDDANYILSQIEFETTLFIFVSKSGTTQETLTNLNIVQKTAEKFGMPRSAFRKHFITVTGKGSPADNPENFLTSFYIDENIGGRYSSTSAAGATVLSLSLGYDIFQELLIGAHKLDESAKNPDIRQNMSLMSALNGVWERNFLKLPCKAVIPYSEALSRFPAHLQQLDCESNGKSVNMNFKPVNYQTGPLIFGEPGTNAQHSFFQKLHQGTDIIPIQFIGFAESQTSYNPQYNGASSQEKLNANLVAQITAFAVGKEDSNQNKTFSGNRPASLLYARKLTPEVMGALLAFYENTVMFQGFLWNINSFDQEGVQLGKVLTNEILFEKESSKNQTSSAFIDLLQNLP
ncbi:MAG: glucose-6-phosphate isomerase [bacterium]|nr:glucose-6-phosphate isomerase [bacterium]